jgi:hypothetical protein
MILNLRARGTRFLTVLVLSLALLGLALSGCGKKNEPRPPQGVPNTYPRPYPSV